jgi:hypothetical protein
MIFKAQLGAGFGGGGMVELKHLGNISASLQKGLQKGLMQIGKAGGITSGSSAVGKAFPFLLSVTTRIGQLF